MRRAGYTPCTMLLHLPYHTASPCMMPRPLARCTELNLLGAAPADPPADGSRRGSALLSQRASAADGSRRGSAMTPRDQHPAMAFNYLRRAARMAAAV